MTTEKCLIDVENEIREIVNNNIKAIKYGRNNNRQLFINAIEKLKGFYCGIKSSYLYGLVGNDKKAIQYINNILKNNNNDFIVVNKTPKINLKDYGITYIDFTECIINDNIKNNELKEMFKQYSKNKNKEIQLYNNFKDTKECNTATNRSFNGYVEYLKDNGFRTEYKEVV